MTKPGLIVVSCISGVPAAEFRSACSVSVLDRPKAANDGRSGLRQSFAACRTLFASLIIALIDDVKKRAVHAAFCAIPNALRVPSTVAQTRSSAFFSAAMRKGDAVWIRAVAGCRGRQAPVADVQALPYRLFSLRGPSLFVGIAELQTAEGKLFAGVGGCMSTSLSLTSVRRLTERRPVRFF